MAAEERHKVLFDYLPENDDELGLKKGEIVTVTNRNVCEGWWEGSCNGKSGVFPNNFVEQDAITEAAPKVKVGPIYYVCMNLYQIFQQDFSFPTKPLFL